MFLCSGLIDHFMAMLIALFPSVGVVWQSALWTLIILLNTASALNPVQQGDVFHPLCMCQRGEYGLKAS